VIVQIETREAVETLMHPGVPAGRGADGPADLSVSLDVRTPDTRRWTEYIQRCRRAKRPGLPRDPMW